MAMATSKTSTILFLVLYIILCISTSCKADKYTAKVDYGYGPLFIELSTKGEKLIRCDKLDINIGGGFGPYRLCEFRTRE